MAHDSNQSLLKSRLIPFGQLLALPVADVLNRSNETQGLSLLDKSSSRCATPPLDFVFETDRAELGLESRYLPMETPNGTNLHYYQSNIRSLLRLNADLSLVLRLKDRRIWSESGDTFIERLKWIAESVSQLEN